MQGRVLSGEVFVGLGGGELLQRAAVALDWWVWHCTAVNKLHSPEVERHTGRSLQALYSGKFYFQEDFLFIGAQSEGSIPHSPAPPLTTNLLPFLPGSGESGNVRISLAECGSEQPEFVARNTAALKICTTLKQNPKSNWVKVLKVLRKLFQKFSKQGLGQSPEVLGVGTESQGLPLTPHSILSPREQPL